MKHYILCNPAAGHNDCTQRIRKEAERVLPEAEFFITRAPGDAERFVRETAACYPDEDCRFYVCGGDGTLLEAASGAAGAANAQIAVIPCGSGNDYVRMFAPVEKMGDLQAQSRGRTVDVNMLRCNGRLAMNICSCGFDARVADWANRNKRFVPFGGIAYKIAVLVCFFRKLDRRYTVEAMGKTTTDDLTMVVAANGRYYGGGFYAVPEAEPDDGVMELVCIRKAGRLQFLIHLPKYLTGRHMLLPDRFHTFMRVKKVTLRTEKPEPVNMDGEIVYADTVTIGIAEEKVRMVVPEGARLLRDCAMRL